MRSTAEDIWSFWFGALDVSGAADEKHRQRWWAKSPAFDAELRGRFGALHELASRGELDDWASTARGRVALVVLLDQLSRNLYRDQARAFAQDERALALAEEGVLRGDDRELPLDPRGFLYMPYMHSEDLDTQERGIEILRAWRETVLGPSRARVEEQLDYAIRHRDIIARFGRFPHRNRALGRTSTPEEVAFLQQPGSSF